MNLIFVQILFPAGPGYSMKWSYYKWQTKASTCLTNWMLTKTKS